MPQYIVQMTMLWEGEDAESVRKDAEESVARYEGKTVVRVADHVSKFPRPDEDDEILFLRS